MSWRCEACGAEHSGLATVFGSDSPWDWHVASQARRDAGELTPDVCFLPAEDPRDGTGYFLRGHVVIPLSEPVEGETSFAWSVWVALDGEAMQLVYDHWDDPARASLPPVFGWLRSSLPYQPSTLDLRVQVHQREPGRVPLVEVDPTHGHPLGVEERDGITPHRVAELNALVLGVADA